VGRQELPGRFDDSRVRLRVTGTHLVRARERLDAGADRGRREPSSALGDIPAENLEKVAAAAEQALRDAVEPNLAALLDAIRERLGD